MDKKGKSLLGMFVPQKWHKMRPYVKRWKHHVHGDSWGKEPEQLACLEFDFSHTYKADIYRDLARAIINKWLQVSMTELACYLAVYSNLADNPDVEVRTRTIYRELKHYKTKVEDWNQRGGGTDQGRPLAPGLSALVARAGRV